MMETKLQQIREHHAAFRKHIEETGNSLRYKELPVLTEEMFCCMKNRKSSDL